MLATIAALPAVSLLSLPVDHSSYYRRSLLGVLHSVQCSLLSADVECDWLNYLGFPYAYMPGVSPWSFEVLDGSLARDRHGVYCPHPMQVDARSIHHIEGHLWADSTRVLYRCVDLSVVHQDGSIGSPDPGSTHLIEPCRILYDRRGVYRGAPGLSFVQLDLADPTSFAIRAGDCAAEDDRARYSLDPQRRYLSATLKDDVPGRNLGGNYMVYEGQVYFGPWLVKGVDAASAELIPSRSADGEWIWLRDRKGAWFAGKRVESADAQKLHAIPGITEAEVLCDDQHVYTAGAEVRSFESRWRPALEASCAPPARSPPAAPGH